VILAAAATLVGASVQSATGFGFALVLSPAMLAMLEPYEAVTALLVLGFALNVLLLFGAGGDPTAVRWRAVGPMLLAALPGLCAGFLLLVVFPKPALQVVVGAAVVAAAIVQARGTAASSGAGVREPTLGAACAVGLASGALTTSTTVSGPPIVLWLQSQGVAPAELRASLAASFLGLSVAGAALLAAGGVLVVEPAVVLPLLAVTVAGHALGARAFRRLEPTRFRSAVLALVLAAGAASLVAGVAGVS
jgi:uncharacterized membrane protein YfcA